MINRYFMELRNNKLITLQIVLLIGVSILLRLVDLGYSSLQGVGAAITLRYRESPGPGVFLPPGLPPVHTRNRDLFELPVCHEWHIHFIRSDRSISILCHPGRCGRDPWSDYGCDV